MLTEAQAQIRDTARRFAQAELAPFAAERDRDRSFPRDVLTRMGELGLMGIMVEPEFGGAGADHVAFALAVTELAAGDGACSTITTVHNGLVCGAIRKFGSPEQKRRFLPALASGAMLGAFALTEPDAGSDAAAIRMSAQRRGNRFVLNGSKQFITSGKSADLALVFAVTEAASERNRISAFLVATGSPGYRVAKVDRTMGQRASDHCQVFFDDCEVAPELMLGEEGAGYRIALANLEGGRIGVAAQSLGMARAAYEIALGYARERKTFGKRIIDHQAIGFQLADMATGLHAAELMILHAARLRDAGEPSLTEASMAKLFATEAAERVCHDAIQILGGYGYLEDFAVERIYRDVRVCKIYEGTSEIQRLVISRQLAVCP